MINLYFKRILTESLSQYSYVLGEDKDMIVIDPQADIDKYLEISRKKGMKIKAVLETHRNEDFTVGSRALAEISGAKVYIAADENLDYKYGTRIKDGEEIKLGSMKIKAIHTPGHTLGSMSYILYLKESPYMAFVGDTLFFGGVGRTDFYGKDKLDEVTGYLYDSIFKKLLPLGDEVLLFPAHGAGSACGASIEDRPYSTLGYERKHNADLQYKDKDEFIKNVGSMLHKPSYFEDMEKINLIGTETLGCNISLKVKYTEDIVKSDAKLIDIRSQKSFITQHIENSLYINQSSISSYINWFISTDKDITFITDNQDRDYLNNLYLDMRRIGYIGELSFLVNGLVDWDRECRQIVSSNHILAKDLKEIVQKARVLDIRLKEEFEDIKPIEGSIKIPFEEIKERYRELPKDETIYIACATGVRSTTVSSFLEQKGIRNSILLGGMEAFENLD